MSNKSRAEPFFRTIIVLFINSETGLVNWSSKKEVEIKLHRKKSDVI